MYWNFGCFAVVTLYCPHGLFLLCILLNLKLVDVKLFGTLDHSLTSLDDRSAVVLVPWHRLKCPCISTSEVGVECRHATGPRQLCMDWSSGEWTSFIMICWGFSLYWQEKNDEKKRTWLSGLHSFALLWLLQASNELTTHSPNAPKLHVFLLVGIDPCMQRLQKTK